MKGYSKILKGSLSIPTNYDASNGTTFSSLMSSLAEQQQLMRMNDICIVHDGLKSFPKPHPPSEIYIKKNIEEDDDNVEDYRLKDEGRKKLTDQRKFIEKKERENSIICGVSKINKRKIDRTLVGDNIVEKVDKSESESRHDEDAETLQNHWEFIQDMNLRVIENVRKHVEDGAAEDNPTKSGQASILAKKSLEESMKELNDAKKSLQTFLRIDQSIALIKAEMGLQEVHQTKMSSFVIRDEAACSEKANTMQECDEQEKVPLKRILNSDRQEICDIPNKRVEELLMEELMIHVKSLVKSSKATTSRLQSLLQTNKTLLVEINKLKLENSELRKASLKAAHHSNELLDYLSMLYDRDAEISKLRKALAESKRGRDLLEQNMQLEKKELVNEIKYLNERIQEPPRKNSVSEDYKQKIIGVLQTAHYKREAEVRKLKKEIKRLHDEDISMPKKPSIADSALSVLTRSQRISNLVLEHGSIFAHSSRQQDGTGV